jgi:hypothetical protein
MKLNFLDNPLHKALLNGNMSFHEVMNTFDIRTKIALNLPSSIYGFVYVSRKGNYHIILNGNINYETQCSVFLHEIKHIIYDMPTIGYIIGLDMQHEEYETEYKLISTIY